MGTLTAAASASSSQLTETFGDVDPIAVRLLGPVAVISPRGDAVLSGRRQRSLVAALALNAGTAVSSSLLVDALWGPDPPKTAFKTLHGHIARLRQALHRPEAADRLVTLASAYRLAIPRADVDGLHFEDLVESARTDLAENRAESAAQQLRSGLALWRGDPVQDGELSGWGVAEVVRLQELRLTALEDLCDAELRLGRTGAAVAELDRLLVHHPLRERLVGLLMLAFCRSGRPADALKAYQRLRTGLAEELGSDPAPELQRLHTAILRQDTEATMSDAASAGSARPPIRLGCRELVVDLSGHDDQVTLDAFPASQDGVPIKSRPDCLQAYASCGVTVVIVVQQTTLPTDRGLRHNVDRQ